MFIIQTVSVLVRQHGASCGSHIETCLTYRPRPGCWAWWPHQGGHVQKSSPSLPKPACRGEQPPRTCPGMRTGSPGCAGFWGGLGSRSLPAELQPKLHCCVGAALWGKMHRAKVSLDVWRNKPWSDWAVNICIQTTLWFSSTIRSCEDFCQYKNILFTSKPLDFMDISF